MIYNPDSLEISTDTLARYQWDIGVQNGNWLDISPLNFIAYPIKSIENHVGIRILHFQTKIKPMLKIEGDVICDIAFSEATHQRDHHTNSNIGLHVKSCLLGFIDNIGISYLYEICMIRENLEDGHISQEINHKYRCIPLYQLQISKESNLLGFETYNRLIWKSIKSLNKDLLLIIVDQKLYIIDGSNLWPTAMPFKFDQLSNEIILAEQEPLQIEVYNTLPKQTNEKPGPILLAEIIDENGLGITAVDISLDGKYLVIGYCNGTIKLYEMNWNCLPGKALLDLLTLGTKQLQVESICSVTILNPLKNPSTDSTSDVTFPFIISDKSSLMIITLNRNSANQEDTFSCKTVQKITMNSHPGGISNETCQTTNSKNLMPFKYRLIHTSNERNKMHQPIILLNGFLEQKPVIYLGFLDEMSGKHEFQGIKRMIPISLSFGESILSFALQAFKEKTKSYSFDHEFTKSSTNSSPSDMDLMLLQLEQDFLSNQEGVVLPPSKTSRGTIDCQLQLIVLQSKSLVNARITFSYDTFLDKFNKTNSLTLDTKEILSSSHSSTTDLLNDVLTTPGKMIDPFNVPKEIVRKSQLTKAKDTSIDKEPSILRRSTSLKFMQPKNVPQNESDVNLENMVMNKLNSTNAINESDITKSTNSKNNINAVQITDLFQPKTTLQPSQNNSILDNITSMFSPNKIQKVKEDITKEIIKAVKTIESPQIKSNPISSRKNETPTNGSFDKNGTSHTGTSKSPHMKSEKYTHNNGLQEVKIMECFKQISDANQSLNNKLIDNYNKLHNKQSDMDRKLNQLLGSVTSLVTTIKSCQDNVSQLSKGQHTMAQSLGEENQKLTALVNGLKQHILQNYNSHKSSTATDHDQLLDVNNMGRWLEEAFNKRQHIWNALISRVEKSLQYTFNSHVIPEIFKSFNHMESKMVHNQASEQTLGLLKEHKKMLKHIADTLEESKGHLNQVSSSLIQQQHSALSHVGNIEGLLHKFAQSPHLNQIIVEAFKLAFRADILPKIEGLLREIFKQLETTFDRGMNEFSSSLENTHIAMQDKYSSCYTKLEQINQELVRRESVNQTNANIPKKAMDNSALLIKFQAKADKLCTDFDTMFQTLLPAHQDSNSINPNLNNIFDSNYHGTPKNSEQETLKSLLLTGSSNANKTANLISLPPMRIEQFSKFDDTRKELINFVRTQLSQFISGTEENGFIMTQQQLTDTLNRVLRMMLLQLVQKIHEILKKELALAVKSFKDEMEVKMSQISEQQQSILEVSKSNAGANLLTTPSVDELESLVKAGQVDKAFTNALGFHMWFPTHSDAGLSESESLLTLLCKRFDASDLFENTKISYLTILGIIEKLSEELASAENLVQLSHNFDTKCEYIEEGLMALGEKDVLKSCEAQLNSGLPKISRYLHKAQQIPQIPTNQAKKMRKLTMIVDRMLL